MMVSFTLMDRKEHAVNTPKVEIGMIVDVVEFGAMEVIHINSNGTYVVQAGKDLPIFVVTYADLVWDWYFESLEHEEN